MRGTELAVEVAGEGEVTHEQVTAAEDDVEAEDGADFEASVSVRLGEGGEVRTALVGIVNELEEYLRLPE